MAVMDANHSAGDSRLREAALRLQMEASLDGILVVDQHGEVLCCNARLKTILGMTDEDLATGRREARTLRMKGLALDPEQFEERLESLLADEENPSREDVRLKDGRILDRRTEPIHDAQGAFIGRIWHIRDVTRERRDAEERDRLAQVVEQSTESILIADRDGVIQYINPAFVLSSGFTAGELAGQTLRDIVGVMGDFPFDEMWGTITRGEAWTSRHTARRKNGEPYKEMTIASPIRGKNGDIVSFVLFQNDVTREDRLETQLRMAQKMEAVGQLAGGIAHDFNNILQAILGYLDLSIESLPDGHEIAEDLKDARKAANRAVTLTRQLLAFSRRQTLQPQYLNLNDLIHNLLNMLRRVIGENIRLEFEPGEDLGAVHADPGQMEQALINLSINARDAMPEGGRIVVETSRVRLDADFQSEHPWAREGSYVLLSVSDTGSGMSSDVRERVFEPFFTTKRDKGTGLGLATVYGIVKQHNGYITVYSEPGSGSTFKIFLPRIAHHADALEKREDTPVSGGRECILLAEDEEMVRTLARRVLSDAGYGVVEAADGQQAIEMFQNRPHEYDLAVLDAVMPHVSGLGVFKAIRATRAELPVLFSSGYSSHVIDPKIFENKEADWIAKPYSPAALLRKVREILDRRE